MKFLCALCVLCGLVSSGVALDREAFTFTKYDLEIRLEPEQQRLGARGKITLRNDSGHPQKIAALFYNIVLEDVNGVINGVAGSGQLFWEKKPAKLVAWEQSRLHQRPTHLPEKKERRVSSESSSERVENLAAMEKLYASVDASSGPYGGYVSPRSAPLRNFITDFQENATFNTTEGLKAAKRFIAWEQDPRIAIQNLQRHLTAERDGSEYPNWDRLQTASGVHDISEFLS